MHQNYTFVGTDGQEQQCTDLAPLKRYLALPSHHWTQNSGDSAIWVQANERLIFFKLTQGVFLLKHPNYASLTTGMI